MEDEELEQQIAKAVEKSLKSFGFQYGIRNCQTPKYGEGAYVEERWEPETVGAFISDDIAKLLDHHIVAVLDKVESQLAEKVTVTTVQNIHPLRDGKYVRMENLTKTLKALRQQYKTGEVSE